MAIYQIAFGNLPNCLTLAVYRIALLWQFTKLPYFGGLPNCLTLAIYQIALPPQ
jgi:hypothetical protein